MMVLYVVRHGETQFNVERRYAGQTNVPLNERGIEQARELARKLTEEPFDVIVTSSLLRARMTAEEVAEYHKEIPFVVMDEFREVCVGVYEGLTREEVQERYPELWARNCTRQVDDAPVGGETTRQVDARVAKGLAMLKEKYPEKSVLLVCHGFVSRVINRQLRELSFEEMHGFSMGNCEVVKYEM